MDGTLVDSMGSWNDVALKYLMAHGMDESVGTLVAQTAHLTTDESAALFCERFLSDISPQEVAASLNARMEELYRHEIREKPGVFDYLDRLKARGVNMCVASSTSEPLIHVCLERLKLLPFFSFILSCETVGSGKSDPAVYLTAAKRLGGKPTDTAVYEDSPTALSTAKRAGFYTVAVYDESSAEHWATLCADAAIKDWRSASCE